MAEDGNILLREPRLWFNMVALFAAHEKIIQMRLCRHSVRAIGRPNAEARQ